MDEGAPFDFDSLPEAKMTGFELSTPEPDFVNVGGVVPLWVERNEVAAVGIKGAGNALIVLKGSGMQLVAKGKEPSEVIQLLCMGEDDAEDQP